MATSARDEALVQLLLERWKDSASGLDTAKTYEYTVLLSFPSTEQPNIVEVGEVKPRDVGVVRAAARCTADSAFLLFSVGPNGTVFHSFQPFEKNLTGEQAEPNVLQPYAAYAPPGTPKVSWNTPPPHYDILALLGFRLSPSKAEASEKSSSGASNPLH